MNLSLRQKPRAVIIGGGIIGCAIALELVRKEMDVTVVDKGQLLAEASTAGAGMLGAHVETHRDGPFFELCKASGRLFRNWAEELREASGGIAPQYEAEGILRVAFDEDDETELLGRLPWIGPRTWLSAEEVRRMEPAVGAEVRGGLFFAEDHRIHPVQTARALRAALARLGCGVREGTPALGLMAEDGRISGVRTSQGPIAADVVVLAAGAWSDSLLAGLDVTLPVFPVKGQCLSVRPAFPVITRTVFTRGCYIIPRLDGTLTVGATQQEAGFDKTATAAGISELYRIASTLLPAVSGAAFLSTWAGLRPGTPDGLPYLGAVPGLPGLIAATGHFRNGILLAPVTAKLVGELAEGRKPSMDLSAYAPGRSVTPARA